MKRSILIIVFALVVLTFAAPVYAEGQQCRIEEMGISFTAPDGYDVFSRGMSEYDPLFTKYSLTRDYLEEAMNAQDIYIDAFSLTENSEITVTIQESSTGEFNDYGDILLNAIASSLEDIYISYGMLVEGYELVRTEQLSFICVYFYDMNTYADGIQYYTSYDGMSISFNLRVYSGSLTSEQKEYMAAMINTVKMDSYVPAERVETEPFVYTDEETGLQFTVPANWQLAEFDSETEYLEAKFANVNDPLYVIMYASIDIWEELPAYERVGLTREEVDNTYLSSVDIADYLGVDPLSVDKVIYNGETYYKATVSYTEQLESLPFQDLEMTRVIGVKNGYLYEFQFSTTEEYDAYKDFEALIESVVYPDIESAGAAQTNELNEDSYDYGMSGVVTLFMLVILVIIVIVICVLVNRKSRSNEPVETVSSMADAAAKARKAPSYESTEKEQ